MPFAHDDEFDRLMGEQRARSSAAAKGGKVGRAEESVRELGTDPAVFVGYEDLEVHTVVQGLATQDDGRVLVKLAESPFYAQGGGQVSDEGIVACEDGDCRVEVVDVVRSGDDQALVVRALEGELHEGERVIASVDRAARHATACNHTATHLLHAALRERLGDHVRQAGSYVGPDKLRFDFTHSAKLSEEDRRHVEDEVNARILESLPVRPITTTLDEAKALGAMALFGEKYGDVVRMVEIGDGSLSRELCGGTHVRTTSEIGLLRIVSEGSSAANVRRIEAITGPAAVQLMREHDELLREAADELRTQPERVPEAVAELRERVKQAARLGVARTAASTRRRSPAAREEIAGAQVLTAIVPDVDAKALMEIGDRVKGQLGEAAAIVLGSAAEGRVHLVAAVTPALVERGVKAGAVVKIAAQVAGGGGGGKDTMAQAGGKDPEKLPEALEAARGAIAAALGAYVRVLALDYGSARCGCALSDPTGTLATPIDPVLRPATKHGLKAIVAARRRPRGRAGRRRAAARAARRRLRPDARGALVRRQAAQRARRRRRRSSSTTSASRPRSPSRTRWAAARRRTRARPPCCSTTGSPGTCTSTRTADA